MPNPIVNNISPNTGRILDEDGGMINIANFLESICSTGYETGASSPSTDIHALTGVVNFNISADADVVAGVTHNVVVNVAGLTTGLLIASAVQSAIRRVGGTTYVGITFAYVGGVYVTTSGAVGPGSKIRITAGTATSGYSDLAAALKVGAANGASDTDGKIAGLPVAISGSNILQTNQQNQVSPGTPVNVGGGTSIPCNRIYIAAKMTNQGNVYLGGPTVSSMTGLVLPPGLSEWFYNNNVNLLWFDTDDASDGISWKVE